MLEEKFNLSEDELTPSLSYSLSHDSVCISVFNKSSCV